MGQSADEIRLQIEQTRSQLTDTATAIQDHVRPRRVARRQLSGIGKRAVAIRESVMGSPFFDHGGSAGSRPGTFNHVGSEGSSARDAFSQAKATAASGVENLQHTPETIKRAAAGSPLAAGLVAMGAGMVVASLIPPSRHEHRAASALSDQLGLKDGVVEAGQHLRSAVQGSA